MKGRVVAPSGILAGEESCVAKRQVFAVATPIGHRVVLSRDRWREIVRY